MATVPNLIIINLLSRQWAWFELSNSELRALSWLERWMLIFQHVGWIVCHNENAALSDVESALSVRERYTLGSKIDLISIQDIQRSRATLFEDKED